MRNKFLIATGVTAVLLGGYWAVNQLTPAKADCVNVTVDYGILKSEAPTTVCVPVETSAKALELANKANLEITGTDKYGLQIACRVNGLPASDTPIKTKSEEKYLEKCTDMPSENAYWAILVRHKSNPWGWADKGVADLDLSADNSLAFVFTVDNNVRWPK